MGGYWDERYRAEPVPTDPGVFVRDELAPLLGKPGRALDLAGGAGRHAIWLAERGWDTTLLEASTVALDLAAERAVNAGVELHLIHADLTKDGLPEDPWDLVIITHYLQRELFPAVAEILSPGGLFAYSIATVRNLERHERPPRRALLDEGEAPSLTGDLEIVFYEEGWSAADRHEARVVARKPVDG
ncbi:MAG: methyltransferase domain-containing protein [Actinomycetota bacterium]